MKHFSIEALTRLHWTNLELVWVILIFEGTKRYGFLSFATAAMFLGGMIISLASAYVREQNEKGKQDGKNH